MEDELFFKELRQPIAENELAKAITLLQNFLRDSPRLDETIVQSARHIDILQQIRMGVVDEQQANLTKNQIRTDLLNLIRELENYKELNIQQVKDYKYIIKKIKDNQGAGTSEVLNNKTTENLDTKELISLFQQDRVVQFFTFIST